MLKKLTIIAFFTGAGQLFSILALKWVSQHGSAEQLKAISQVDSIVLLMLSLVGLGLQSAAMRDLALAVDWKEQYQRIQSARLALALLLCGLSAIGFLNPYYLLFLGAPLLAWNGDYALYARGFPIAGSITSFLRLVIPFSAIILVVRYHPEWLVSVYVCSLIFTYVITNLGISRKLGTPVAAIPRFKHLGLYLKSVPLGIVVLSLYFIGQGLILFIPYFYNNTVVAVAFVGLKFYVVYKGALRIVHQAFMKEMLDEVVCLKVDQLSIIAGITFAGSMLIFPESFIRLFFGPGYLPEKEFFVFLAVAAFVYSLFLSMSTKSMLSKKDKEYTIITAMAAGITIVSSILLSLLWQNALSIAISLCLGEITWAIGLLKISATASQIRNRISFVLQTGVLLVIPVAVRYFCKDSLPFYASSFGVFLLLLLLLHYRKFQTLTHQ